MFNLVFVLQFCIAGFIIKLTIGRKMFSTEDKILRLFVQLLCIVILTIGVLKLIYINSFEAVLISILKKSWRTNQHEGLSLFDTSKGLLDFWCASVGNKRRPVVS